MKCATCGRTISGPYVQYGTANGANASPVYVHAAMRCQRGYHQSRVLTGEDDHE